MIGELLGNRYELLEKIGEGGMSIVYKGRCNKLNRFVAVKILKREFCDNEEIVKKFKIEATAIATLSDTNIVNVLDVGTQEDTNFIVMEYVNGKTLKEVIKEFGNLDYQKAISVGLQIAKALECAHKNGIIHRDVKPQNILISEGGLVKVTDFGIAKSVASSTMTSTTTIMGSAHYFSPEQAKGEVVDTRTDLYSFGVVLYEMVTGKLPFDAESPVTIALKHIQEKAVPPKSLNSSIPQGLNDLIIRLMDKEANNRYQSAREVIEDLQRIKEDPNYMLNGVNIKSEDEGHTIIMDAVNPDRINNTSNNEILEDDYYEDDDYYDDDYYDEDEYDELKKKKRNRIIIGSICGIIALILIFFGAFLLFSGGSNKESEDMVKIPELKGLTLEQAEVALEREGLILVDAGSEKSDEEKGIVIEVDPEEGVEVKKGSKVRVITSSGTDKVEMPDFKDSNLETVKTFLSRNKITNVTYIYQYSSTIEEGYVITTDPASDTLISSDTEVTVYVSKGPEIKYIPVPDVIGLTFEDAKEALEKVGLEISKLTTEVDDKSQDGLVQSQTNSGKSVEEGSTVTVYVGEYKEKTLEVGSIGLVTDMSVEGARAAIEDAASKAGIEVNINVVGTGVLVKWSPVSGVLKNGSTITLTFKESTEEPGTDPSGGGSDTSGGGSTGNNGGNVE